MILVKIYLFFFIIDAIAIIIYMAQGRKRRIKDGEEILNQLFKTENKTHDTRTN